MCALVTGVQTCALPILHDHQGAEKGSGSTTDPVCGMTVDPATTPHIATHGGEHNYFCSAGCLAKFEADPDRYAVKREPAAADAPEGAIWTCPMHPELQQAGPGSCPICGMALEPVMPTASDGPSEERSEEEHTSELQSLMRISYAVFCLKKKKKTIVRTPET